MLIVRNINNSKEYKVKGEDTDPTSESLVNHLIQLIQGLHSGYLLFVYQL